MVRSPWRVTSLWGKMPSPFAMAQREPCPYCENFAGRYSAAAGPPPVLFENDRLMAYLNPASHGGMHGHTLVVPKRHVETILGLTSEEEAELAHTVAHAARVLTRELTPDGVLIVQRNGLAAEQTVNHVHFHVIPRRDGVAWPPTEWVDMIPLEQRQELAASLSAAW